MLFGFMSSSFKGKNLIFVIISIFKLFLTFVYIILFLRISIFLFAFFILDIISL